MTIDSAQLGVLIFWVFFAILSFYEILMYIRGKSSENWRAHSARIVKLGINVRLGDDGKDESSPFIEYEYNTNGQLYKGTKVVYGDIWTTNYGDSCDDIQGLKVGSEITVFVNPQSPKMSVMKKGYRGNFLFIVVVLIVAVILALINF